MLKAVFLTCVCCFALGVSGAFSGQEINVEGWPVPDVKGLTSYSMTVGRVDGVEKIIEKFNTVGGGHVARVSGNGKVYAYAVDKDREPPIDYLLLDPDGSGRFTLRLGPEDTYLIPEWVSVGSP